MFKRFLILLIFLLAITGKTLATNCPTGYSYAVAIPIAAEAGMSGSSVSNFPMLFIGAGALATVANGGQVQSSTGVDIIFCTASSGGTLLNFERVSYNPVTGAMEAYVLVPTVSKSSTNTIYVLFGNASATEQSNPTFWASYNFLAVYHCGTPSSLSVADSTGTNTSTNHGAVAGTGIVGGACGFSGSQYVDLGGSSTLNTATVTVEAWINPAATPNYSGIAAKWHNASPYSGYELYAGLGSNEDVVCQFGGGSNGGAYTTYNTSPVLTNGSWTNIACTITGTTLLIYKSGVSQSLTNDANLATGVGSPSETGWMAGTTGGYFNGSLDEIRISNVARSADWLYLTYQSIQSPATFYSTGFVSNPTASPAAGSYFGSQTVTLSDSTGGATIFYTTDGTTPTHSGSTPTGTTQVYSSTISVTSSKTIKTIAYLSGAPDSGLVTAAYSILTQGTLVQAVSKNAYGNESQTVTLTAGNTAVVFVNTGGAAASISDAHDTFTKCNSAFPVNQASMYQYCWIANNLYGGSTTISTSGASSDTGIVIMEFTVPASATGDVYGATQLKGTTAMTVTTNQSVTSSAELVLGFFAQDSGTYYTWTAGSGFTAPAGAYGSGGSTNLSEQAEYQWVGGASGTQTCPATQSVSNASYYTANICVTIKFSLVAATPTFSIPTGTYFAPVNETITSQTSGSTILYSTTGTATDAGGCTAGSGTSSGASPVTISNITATTTFSALACEVGYADSGLASATITSALPISTLATDNFSQWYNTTLQYGISQGQSGSPYQYPLDAFWTQGTISGTNVAYWTQDGPIPIWPYNDWAQNPTGYGVLGGGTSNGAGVALRTAETYNANQWSSIKVHSKGYGTNSDAWVGVRCTAGSSLNGDFLEIKRSNNTVVLAECISGTCSTLGTATLPAWNDGDSYTLNIFGTVLAPQQNGNQVTGLSSTYTSAISSGAPCLGAYAITTIGNYPGVVAAPVGLLALENGYYQLVTTAGTLGGSPTWNTTPGGTTTDGTAVWTNMGAIGYQTAGATATLYNWSGGDLGVSSPPIVPIAYAPTYSNYANLYTNTNTNIGYPWEIDGLPTWSLIVPLAAGSNYGNLGNGTYAWGATAGASQEHYQVPITDTQWIEATIALDSTAWNNRNWFLKLQSQAKIPPTWVTPPYSGCYDVWSVYVGDEPFYQQSSLCSSSLEYCGTNFLHSTYDNDTTSTPYPDGGCTGANGNYNIWTAFGSLYSPMYGDQILAKYNASQQKVTVYCKGGNSHSTGWPGANTAVTVQVPSSTSGISGMVITVNGIYQLATEILWTKAMPLPLGAIVTDSNGYWQKVTTAGTTNSTAAPAWNDTTNGVTYDGGGSAVVYQCLGLAGTPTTGSVQPSSWGNSGSNVDHGAITVDGTVMWRYVGSACASTAAFIQVASVQLVGFSSGYPGIWAASGGNEPAFQYVNLGYGEPCSTLYTCLGASGQRGMIWMAFDKLDLLDQLLDEDEQINPPSNAPLIYALGTFCPRPLEEK